MSLRGVLTAWTSVCIFGRLVTASVLVGNEATCNESTSLLCFKPRQIWLATGIFVGALWLAGVLVVAVVAALRRRRKPSQAPPDG
jgi:hypothetical protein